MDDVIKLVSTTYETDEYLNQIPVTTEREVFCQVNSVGRSEFYAAAQNDMHPEYVFVISHYKDYLGEKFVKYTDWTGTEKVYYVTRTYRRPDADSVELTVVERTADGVSIDTQGGGGCDGCEFCG